MLLTIFFRGSRGFWRGSCSIHKKSGESRIPRELSWNRVDNRQSSTNCISCDAAPNGSGIQNISSHESMQALVYSTCFMFYPGLLIIRKLVV